MDINGVVRDALCTLLLSISLSDTHLLEQLITAQFVDLFLNLLSVAIFNF